MSVALSTLGKGAKATESMAVGSSDSFHNLGCRGTRTCRRWNLILDNLDGGFEIGVSSYDLDMLTERRSSTQELRVRQKFNTQAQNLLDSPESRSAKGWCSCGISDKDRLWLDRSV